ncbi:MAG TPA: phosphatidylglycerophosphatase A [Ignavibacteria bacterium]|nr:phosphatidylglycerophosphatase A [Ignavibacteria bacterium]HMR40593.1 phosphatidylglycerophosphatase A [Ignavibacteria bacterium]
MRLNKERKIADENIKIDFFTNLFSSFLYTGYSPKASGTVASAFAMIIFSADVFFNPLILFVLSFVCFAAGIFSSGKMIKRFGDDPSEVVIDEAVGMWLTVLIFILLNGDSPDILGLIICFLAFRFFDITKIQPAKYFDELNSGFGVMMDDVIAGAYAGVCAYASNGLIQSLMN